MLRSICLLLTSFIILQNLSAQKFETLKDERDGKIYKIVMIGEQEWMAENLNTVKFQNGELIPEAKTKEDWMDAGFNQKPAWCYYNFNVDNGLKFGKLYNWYAVTDPRGIAPIGYHIPSDSEWIKLSNFLDGENSSIEWNPARLVGGRLKNTSGWNNYIQMFSYTCSNCSTWNSKYKRKVACDSCKDTRKVQKPVIMNIGNNSSGFSGLPGGRCQLLGHFDGIGEMGIWWSATEGYSATAFRFGLSYRASLFYRDDDNKGMGYSVRCIKD